MSANRKVFVNSFEVHHDPGGVRSVMDYKLKHYNNIDSGPRHAENYQLSNIASAQAVFVVAP